LSSVDPVSVVVPVYNSEKSLPILVDRLRAVFFQQNRTFELIFIDDRSRDTSWSVICELARLDPIITGVRMLRNYGQHNALLCGIRAARYPIIVTMDDDLQNPPEEVPRLLTELNSEYDVVYGTPLFEAHGLWRDLASQITKLVLRHAMGAETAGKVSAFRAFRTSVSSAFSQYRSPYVSIDVLLTWGTQRFTSIPVRNDVRTIGTSNYTVGKLVRHALNMMTGFSVLPLQIASLLGFSMTVGGGLALLWILGRYLAQGSVVPGFAFLGCMIAIFSGAQLFSVGIIGEYIARIHLRTMDRPSYAIDTIIDQGNNAVR
jgi:glycosyltransferase involved in cell wall biosynthesis